MGVVVPFCEEIGIAVPAHFDQEQGKFVIDVPFPMRFVAEKKRWEIEEGQIGWDQVIDTVEGARPDEQGVRRHPAARPPSLPAQRLPEHERPMPET